MADDPLTAVVDQLAAWHEHLTALDAREAAHFASLSEQLTQLAALVAATGQALHAHTTVLARVEALEHAVTALVGPAGNTGGQPGPAWWTLTGPERQEAVAQLRSWVKEVYRPGYGHLAAALGACWEAHDLCLYGLDILAELWQALYLQPSRSSALLSAQAEYQARILPAIAAQLAAETTGCGHDQPRAQPPAYARSRP